MNLEATLKQAEGKPVELTDDATMQVLEQLNPAVAYVRTKYDEARNGRKTFENRWLKGWANFRGSQTSTTAFMSNEVSKAFIKITKTKTLAAYGQILDVLLANGQIPIEIKPSPVPMGVEEYVHVDPNEAPQIGTPTPSGMNVPDEAVLGYPGDGQDLAPGETILDRTMKWLKAKTGLDLKPKSGAGHAPNRIVYKPAEEAAIAMNKRIHDQFADMGFHITLKQAELEKEILGTSVLKGPFNRLMEYPEWDKDGNYVPKQEIIPFISFVSVWNFYPDPQAWNMKQAAWVIERHKLNRSELRDLKKNASFRASEIELVISTDNPNYVFEDFENTLDESARQVQGDRYEVLEFWGTIDKKMMESSGVSLGFELPEGMEELPVNIWVCGNRILRFVLNPLTPARIPYYPCPYEVSLYSIFGVGIPENMEDTQLLMNGFMRLAVDNAVLSGSVMLELDESVLVPGQTYKVETGKIFRKNAGAPNQRAVQSIQITNTSQQNMQMFDTARRLADEATGIPSFSHGLTGVQGVGRTAGGISMLMGAASQTIKTVIKNIDDFWLEPIGKAMIYWNMQFKFDPKLRGDISAIAKGTSSLMQKEVKSQRLLQFAQVVFANPAFAPWVNAKEWLKEFGKSLELETELLLNRPDEAALQARIIQMAGGVNGTGSMPSMEEQGAPSMGSTEAPQQEPPQASGPSQQPQGVGNVGKSAEQQAGVPQQPSGPQSPVG